MEIELRGLVALLARQDPAAETIVWYAMGVKPSRTLTGKIDRRVLLPAAIRTLHRIEAATGRSAALG